MSDRELLEAAAKAAGLVWDKSDGRHRGLWIVSEGRRWNPLTDDGDAHRLAVRLCITLYFGRISKCIQAHIRADLPHKPRWWASKEPLYANVEYVPEEMWTNGNESDSRFANWYMQNEPGVVRGLEAATRKAIVCAAALIGANHE